MDLSRYGSRKFLTAMACLVSTHWSLMERLINGDQYKTIVVAIVGLYGAANVLQKKVEQPKPTA